MPKISHLTEQDKQEIIDNKEGLSQRKLAKKYGVSHTTIRNIQNPEARKSHAERASAWYYKNKAGK